MSSASSAFEGYVRDLSEPFADEGELAKGKVVLHGVGCEDAHQQGVDRQTEEEVPTFGDKGGEKIEDDGQ